MKIISVLLGVVAVLATVMFSLFSTDGNRFNAYAWPVPFFGMAFAAAAICIAATFLTNKLGRDRLLLRVCAVRHRRARHVESA
jgi:uncharacterized membrane protein